MNNKEDNLGYLINKASKLMRYKLNEKLKEHELTASQWGVLNDIYLQETFNNESKDTSPASIAGRLYIDRPTLSGIIERLNKKNWITASPNPRDRRSQIINLTPKARNIINDLESLSNDVVAYAVEDFNKDEISTLVSLLRRIINNLK